MLRKRIIVCLDVDGGRVVKGTRFLDLRDMGDPVELADRYQQQGADEIAFLDISASNEARGTVLDVVRSAAERLLVPLTVGGGVRTVEDIARLLRSGADKVAINSAAVTQPSLLTEAAKRFGAQCVVASIDARRASTGTEVFTHGGSQATGLDTIEWARQCASLGAGEILLTAIDQDGVRNGYDIELTAAVCDAVDVPVIASGGAGTPDHFVEVFQETRAEAALAAGTFHEAIMSVGEVKAALQAAGVPARQERAS